VASPRAQVTAALRHGVRRPGPDDTYADGDDASWLQVDWPSLQREVRVQEQRVNVLDTGGSGPPLVFIHGWSANWQSWLLNIPAFMRTHRCVALDLPGFGQSPMPSEPISIHGYAATVDGVCDALGINTVSVIGNSMGGFIGAELALAFPTRVQRLVLVSAAGLSIEQLRPGPALAIARLVDAGLPYASRFESPIVRRARLRRAAMQWVARYPEKLSPPLTQELVQSTGKPGFVPALRALMSYSFRERLGEIEIPVLIVWGREDMLVPVADAEAYAQLIGPNARVVIFDDTGHVPMIERPSRFNELVAEFLAGEPEPEAGVEGVSA
jgi:pimeloyl-ACP methyl ester carboxylesterase